MVFPERFSNLPAYAFPRLRALLDVHPPGGDVLHMTIGEPRHEPPDFVGEMLAERADGFAKYPPNEGTEELRGAISDWLKRRYGADVDPETCIMALNGTREGLFNACLALSPETKNSQKPAILVPNPFYQVYAVAAVASGADPIFLPATAETGFLPDLDAIKPEVLNRTTVFYLCSPSNPQGAVASRGYWAALLDLAETHDFRIFADECYSEIYRSEAPAGLLEVAQENGADPERVVIFHSLSKRSNLPGLRSGFVAAGPQSMQRIQQLRAYAGAPLPLPIQDVSARVWREEDHVEKSRARYQTKYGIADNVLGGLSGYAPPDGGFFVWLKVKDGEETALRLWTETGIRVLPGAYLGRDTDTGNPGAGYIRIAMVAHENELEDGLTRLRDCIMRND